MIFKNLIECADKLGGEADLFYLKLATRIVNNEMLPPGKVQVNDVGEFRIDVQGKEIDILPTYLMHENAKCLTMKSADDLILNQPNIDQFLLNGITELKKLADGGNAQRTISIIGTYIDKDDKEIWLILGPEDQWPEDFFHQ